MRVSSGSLFSGLGLVQSMNTAVCIPIFGMNTFLVAVKYFRMAFVFGLTTIVSVQG